MDPNLKKDIDRFLSVYQESVEGELKSQLPAYAVQAAGVILANELALLRTSLINRMEEEFRR